ncbi:hypothetical protein [Xenorhabdus ehlersii]|uniref:Uncharacterized protein n=1 Tax=Xenorhabdus ehlersii TaxID=290111 RepID=A0A2D0IMK6_9GAMM|nr:hypothetical protein [Xenorhabdus ehlersii]PHM23008.1 hypothetical protein Xehl_03242 [Xenorhabdus ehlersii]RKE92675.1 hypothetical protein BDE27_0332 [Xenorhabdus ehlersii]
MANINEIFGRINQSGNVDILYMETGENVTRIEINGLYPVGSNVSSLYEHPAGIELILEDALRVGIEIEQ